LARDDKKRNPRSKEEASRVEKPEESIVEEGTKGSSGNACMDLTTGLIKQSIGENWCDGKKHWTLQEGSFRPAENKGNKCLDTKRSLKRGERVREWEEGAKTVEGREESQVGFTTIFSRGAVYRQYK